MFTIYGNILNIVSSHTCMNHMIYRMRDSTMVLLYNADKDV